MKNLFLILTPDKMSTHTTHIYIYIKKKKKKTENVCRFKSGYYGKDVHFIVIRDRV